MLPRWARRCGAACTERWNETIGRLWGLTATRQGREAMIVRPGTVLAAIRRRVRPQHVVLTLSGVLVLAYGISTYMALHRCAPADARRCRLDDREHDPVDEIGSNRADFRNRRGAARHLADARRCCRRAADRPPVKALLTRPTTRPGAPRPLILDPTAAWSTTPGSTRRGARLFDQRVYRARVGRPAVPLYRTAERNPATGTWSIMVSRPLLHATSRSASSSPKCRSPSSPISTARWSPLAGCGCRCCSTTARHRQRTAREEIIGNRAADAAAVLAARGEKPLRGDRQHPGRRQLAVVAFAHIPARPLIIMPPRAGIATSSARGAANAKAP